MSEDNLARLKAAYRRWHDSRGADTGAWLDLASDDMRLFSTSAATPQLAFAGHRNSKAEVVDYLTAILKDWAMVHYSPETFVSEGDRIVMFGRCAWAHKATGKIAEVHIAHLWRFSGTEVVELTEVFDTARAAAAATA